jgi:hypothetical protein
MSNTQRTDALRERLAEEAHKAWSAWMRYLFSKSVELNDGIVLVPKWAVDRWNRQMTTAYADLSEDEKESDRREADRYLVHIEQLEQLVQRAYPFVDHASHHSDARQWIADHDRIMHGGEDAPSE